MEQFWSQVFLGNTLKDWVIAVGIIVVTLVGLRIVRKLVLNQLRAWSKNTNTTFDDFIISLIDRFLIPYLYLLGIYFGVQVLTLSPKADRVADVVVMFVSTYFIVRMIASTISYFINSYVGAHTDQAGRKKQARGIVVLVNILVWAIGILFLVDNLGYNVTTIITGLGIGGVAIALASQAILGDLFSYFVIFFDKPFEIGDFVITGDKLGTIEYVGIKTTRIRSLSGEQVIFSNTDLTNSRVHNYKRMERRRLVFTFRISYATPMDKLEKIPAIVKEAILSQTDTQFDRAHLLSFGDFSYNFEVVYFVMSPDYNIYMDRQQAINFYMIKTFEKEGIRFAYPTQNLIIGNGNGNGSPKTSMEQMTQGAQPFENQVNKHS